MEELEIPSSDWMRSSETASVLDPHLMSAVHPTPYLQSSSSSSESIQRATSVYGYPVTPPASHNEQFASPASDGSTPQTVGNKAKISAVNYFRPYQRTFASTQIQGVNQNGRPIHGHSVLPHDDEYEEIQHHNAGPAEHERLRNIPAKSAYSQHSPPSVLGDLHRSPALPYSDSAATHLAYAAESPQRPPRPTSPNESGGFDMLFPSPPSVRHHQSPSMPFHQNTAQQIPSQGYYSPERSYHAPIAQPTTPLQTSYAIDGLSASAQSSEAKQHSSGEKNHIRSPSASLAHAIAKHRAQRSAAGLTTEGEYYVDPKTGKHYFVAHSGSKSQHGQKGKGDSGGAKEEESISNRSSEKKKKERRKLYKKESGWEVTKVKPTSPPKPSQNDMLNDLGGPASLPMSHGRSGSQSNWSAGSASDEERPSRWKPWVTSSKSRGQSTSPQQRLGQQQQQYHQQQQQQQQTQIGQVWKWGHLQRPTQDLYDGLASDSPSPSMNQLLRVQTTPVPLNTNNQFSMGNSDIAQRLEKQRPDLLTTKPIPGTPISKPSMPGRAGSLYSNYSYYGDLLLDGSPNRSPRLSPAASPTGFEFNPTGIAPESSPYIAPNGDAFQLGSDTPDAQGQVTLNKAKRSNSMMLLAVTKQSNLTVPKGPGGKHDQLDLSGMDPNDPLVCLHLGIDAHENGELEKSAVLFERSARQGCGLGMLMYGLALRHGWVGSCCDA